MHQIQQQIQSIRQDLQNISQVASQLQQAEQNNRVQLQQLQQNETMAFAQLQHLQQVIAHVSQGVNQINTLALQSAQTQTGLPYGANWGTYGTAAPGTFTQGGTYAGQYYQPGTFASGGVYGPYSVSGTYAQGIGTQFGQGGWSGGQSGTGQWGTGQFAQPGSFAGSGAYSPYTAGGTYTQGMGSQFGQTGWSGGQMGTGQWGTSQFTQPGMSGYGSFSGAMYQPYRSQFEIGQLGSSSQYGNAAQGSVGNVASTAGGLQSSAAAGGYQAGGSYQSATGKM